jgi:hypothetical protein
MRRASLIGDGVRAVGSMGGLMAALLLVASGCQLIAGSYSADGIDTPDASATDATGGPGPNCKRLATCCGSLDQTEGAICLSAVQKENEDLCTATLVGLPAGSCTKTPGSDGGTHPEGSTPPGDAKVSDVSMAHDGSGSKDTGTKDVTPDTSNVDLDGTWTLTEITCNGSNLGLGTDTTTLSFSTGSAEEVDTMADGCVYTLDLTSVTISATDINAGDGTITCSTECTTSDSCGPGDTGAVDLPYTLKGGTLSLSQSEDTSVCSSGVIFFDFTK